MIRREKHTILADAIAEIPNGATVALGGSLIRRHPTALIHELIRQKKRDLVLLGWNNGIDFDILVGAGCAREVHTAYVGLSVVGLARNFRRWAACSGTWWRPCRVVMAWPPGCSGPSRRRRPECRRC